MSVVTGALAASMYAVVRSFLAFKATESLMCLTPVTVPGGNPVTDEPGSSPRLPVITLGPVLVTVEPARTVKLRAVPRFGLVAAKASSGATATRAPVKKTMGIRNGRRLNIDPPWADGGSTRAELCVETLPAAMCCNHARIEEEERAGARVLMRPRG